MKTVKGYPLLLGYIGIFLILTGIINLIPLVMLIAFPEESVFALNFIIPGVSSIIIGYLLTLIIRHKEKSRFERFEDSFFLTVMWSLSILVCSVPFLLAGYDFLQSLFESTSGLSTTGSTVFSAHELPYIYIFFRSVLLFFGGVGLVLVITSTVSDRYGMRLYTAEGHNDKLMSNLAKSARLILTIYAGYILFGTIAFILLDMPWFDALNHSIAAVATGGFSTENLSIGHYDSFLIELVAIILMLLGATSFLIHMYLFKGVLKKVFKHGELYLMIGLVVIFTTIMTFNLYENQALIDPYGHHDIWHYLRHSVFTLVSAITTTGLQTVENFHGFTSFSLIMVASLMVVGGQLGSTAGALKQGRVVLALQSSYWFIRDKMSHSRTIRTNFMLRNGEYEQVDDVEIRHNYAFIIIYLMILMLGSFIIMSFGHSFEDALFEFASALGGVGFSTGIMHYQAPWQVLSTGIAGMFIGRLEFTVIIIAIFKLFFDITKKDVR